MTRKGLPEEVTFTPTPEHEDVPAVKTRGSSFPGRRHSKCGDWTKFGVQSSDKKPVCLGTLSEGHVGEMGGRERGLRRAVLHVGRGQGVQVLFKVSGKSSGK